MLSRTCRSLSRSGGANQLFTKTSRCVPNSRLSDKTYCHGAAKRHFHTSNALLSKDYYKLLGVTKNSTAADIKKAYYQLAKKHHPDVSKGQDSEKKFQEISEAYEVLGDDGKKKEYDTYGGQSPPHPFGGGHSQRQHRQGQQMDAEDLFKQAFGGNFDFESMFGGEERQKAPSMSRYEMTISFVEACIGVTRNVKLQFPIQCQRCEGRGGEPGTKTRTCNRCKGTGQTISKVGWYAMQQQCVACGGNGSVVSQACTSCLGKKTVNKTENAEIKIPAGVDAGTVMTYTTEHGTQVGITLQVTKSKVFQRNDLDIMSSANIDMVKAVIGGKVEVDSLTGKVEVTVPKNTQPGATLRLQGKGISGKLTGRGKGHHILKLNVVIPRDISRKQQLLFEAFGGDEGNNEELITLLGGRLPNKIESTGSGTENTSSSKRTRSRTTIASETSSTSSSENILEEESNSSHTDSSNPSKEDSQSEKGPEKKSSWTEFKKSIEALVRAQILSNPMGVRIAMMTTCIALLLYIKILYGQIGKQFDSIAQTSSELKDLRQKRSDEVENSDIKPSWDRR